MSDPAWMDTDYVDSLHAEIERLRAENEEMRRTFGSHPLFAEQRRKTIEECARVADEYGCGPAVIEAIRALKDKQ